MGTVCCISQDCRHDRPTRHNHSCEACPVVPIQTRSWAKQSSVLPVHIAAASVVARSSMMVKPWLWCSCTHRLVVARPGWHCRVMAPLRVCYTHIILDTSTSVVWWSPAAGICSCTTYWTTPDFRAVESSIAAFTPAELKRLRTSQPANAGCSQTHPAHDQGTAHRLRAATAATAASPQCPTNTVPHI